MQSRKSKEDRHHNDQKKKDKRTSNDLQNATQRLKMEQHQPTKNQGLQVDHVSSLSPTSDTCCVTVKRYKHHLAWRS